MLIPEPGADIVVELVHSPEGAAIGAVNLSEVVAHRIVRGMPEAQIRDDLQRLNLDVIAFDEALAYQAGVLRPLTRQAGLSFGDRACLALAQCLGLPAVTADRGWTALQLPVTVQVIR